MGATSKTTILGSRRKAVRLNHTCRATLLFTCLITAGSAQAQTSVAYSPGFAIDKLSWGAFVDAMKPAGSGTLTFETWPTDAETFDSSPGLIADAAARQARRFQPSLLNAAHLPTGLRAQLEAGGVPTSCGRPGNPGSGNFPTPFTANPPTNCIAEEVRRNLPSYNYIKMNKLDTSVGLAAAFTQPTPIVFPHDAVEIKIDWIPVPTLIQFLNNNGVTGITPAVVAQNYFITQQGSTQYAMSSVHISTKDLPSWLWATFEHRWNPGRCDTMGCYDEYGVLPPLTRIAPASVPNTQYPACPKSPELAAMFRSAGLPDVWQNYCLKSAQIDFVSTQLDTQGQPVLSGDSIVERINADVPIAQSSCITCHAYAAFNKDGKVCRDNSGLQTPAPVGPFTPQAGQKTFDFVWGIIFYFDRNAPCTP
jgi:hypothetical protein